MNRKRIISFLLAIVLAAGLFPITAFKSFAYTNVTTSLPFTFVKTGRVVTLIKDYDDYYMMRENFAADGSYVENVVIQTITPAQYEAELSIGNYDVNRVTEITSSINNRLINPSGGRLYLVNMISNSDGRLSNSFIASLGNGYNNTLKMSALTKEYGNPHSFLFNNNGRYFRGTTNTITGVTTLVPIEQDTFSLLRMTMTLENISYLRETLYSNDESGRAHFSDKIYSPSDTLITAIVNDGVEIDTSISDVLNGRPFIDTSTGNPSEGVDSFDSERYGDKYEEWTDDFNSGYIGSWEDPSYLGEMNLIEWADPFWKNSDIGNGNGIAVGGYYDDLGNWIATDINGNPIPSVPGAFDSAGNFKPDGLNGYYDPDGVYHPLFEIDNDITINDNKIYIDDVGYFDRYGTWHEEVKTMGTIYLYDGSYITPEGLLFDAEGKPLERLESDMWGNFVFGSWIIYNDGTVFDTSTYELILNNGTSYLAEFTEEGNYFFDNGTIIVASSNTKGTRIADNTISLENGSTMYENGIIEYKNGLIYNDETIVLSNGEMIRSKFVDGQINLGDYGIVYANGHYAEIDRYGNLMTDDDRIIFPSGEVMLPNGYIWKNRGITVGYMDGNHNLITTTGDVYTRSLKKGTYGQEGNFIENGSHDDGFYYDRMGNQINLNGTVVFNEKIGYYNDSGEFVEGTPVYDNGYYTCDGHWISAYGQLTKAKNSYGYKDDSGNFVMYDGSGEFDAKGVFYRSNGKNGFYINKRGNLVSPVKSSFVINMDGTISLLGEKSTYAGDGIFKVDKNLGYYDEYGRFVISRTNPYIEEVSGFYDSNQVFHKANEIYKDNKGNFKLLNTPSLGLTVENGMIGFSYSAQKFTPEGLTTEDSKTGYYNASGEFIESETSPFLGGFYTKTGTWIDASYYTNFFGETCVNNGEYIYSGNYITPSGDIGYFEKDGSFVLNKLNPYTDGFYDYQGIFHNETFVYRDCMGLYKGFGVKFISTPDGMDIEYTPKDISIGGYRMIYPGIFANLKNELGVFNSDGEFLIDKNSYIDGTYLPNGRYVDYTKEKTSIGNFTFIKDDIVMIKEDDSTFVCTFDGYSIELFNMDGIYTTINAVLFNRDLKYLVPAAEDLQIFVNAMVSGGFNVGLQSYVEPLNDNGYFESDGTFYSYDGTFGYYESDGSFVEGKTNPYINGFYSSKAWVGDAVPDKGHFNSFGIPRHGENGETGYFDFEGTWHSSDSSVFIDVSGNAHVLSTDAIGYKDTAGRLHLYGVEGCFDVDGTYILDNTIMGYYTKDGELKNGKNPSFEGFYDMNQRWFLFGDSGYFEPNGKYIESIAGEMLGYYNSLGEFTEGYNPFLNGYYGFNGEWSRGNRAPISLYFDIKGFKHVGSSPYKNGFYDMNGSWYFTGEKGFYDKHGTYYNITTQEVGYYDMLGIYYEGTNPYQHGYYDPDKNLHLFGQEGYYKADGTYVDIKGDTYYYMNGGLRREGSNPNKDGFYDVRGNWHEFGKNGYYSPDSLFHDYLLIVSTFKVGSDDYILFEGYFDNTDYVSPQIKNTVQFSIYKNGLNTRFLDTGIRVAANAMISYDKATDILHAISIYNDGIFIEDNNCCLLFYEGNIINLKNEGKISIKKLKDKFVDADIDIVVARSRIGEKYALAEMIETDKEITVYDDGNKVNLTYPMVVQNGIPYVAVNDFTSLMIYDARAVSTDAGTMLLFNLKDNILNSDGMVDSITTLVGSYNISITYGDMVFTQVTEKPFTSVKLDAYVNSIVYMPASMISVLTGKHVELDTLNYRIEMTTIPGESPIHDN